MIISSAWIIRSIISLSIIAVCPAAREGDICNTNDGGPGICKRTLNCAKAAKDMAIGIYPRVCGFSGLNVIVCCPEEIKHTLTGGNANRNPGGKDYDSIGGRNENDDDNDPDAIHFAQTLPSSLRKTKAQQGGYDSNNGEDYDDDRIRFVYNRPPTNAKVDRDDNDDDDENDANDDRIRFVYKEPLPKKSKADLVCDRYVQLKCPAPPKYFAPLRVLIVGGREAVGKEYPHMALIGFGEKNDKIWSCGGSLISEKFVLSAAHCASSYSLGPVRWVRLGELDYETSTDDSQPTDYEIINRIVHPDYRSSSVYNDIALFELDRTVRFNAYIFPICLQTDSNPPGDPVATGWGQTDMGNPVSSALRTVQLNYIPTQTCYNIYGRSEKYERGIDGATMICAGELKGGQDTCTGDSGGPLQRKSDKCHGIYVQIGITSFGRGCALSETAGVYTKISHYIPWIESVVWK